MVASLTIPSISCIILFILYFDAFWMALPGSYGGQGCGGRAGDKESIHRLAAGAVESLVDPACQSPVESCLAQAVLQLGHDIEALWQNLQGKAQADNELGRCDTWELVFVLTTRAIVSLCFI